MRYVYGKEIVKPVPASAIVKIVFGSLLAVPVLIFIFAVIVACIFTPDSDIESQIKSSFVGTIFSLIPMFVVISPAAVLLLIFGIKASSKSKRITPQHDPEIIRKCDPRYTFFTTYCDNCSTRFAYQHSDLGYRPWFPKGYVRCPFCDTPNEHSAIRNVYKPE